MTGSRIVAARIEIERTRNQLWYRWRAVLRVQRERMAPGGRPLRTTDWEFAGGYKGRDKAQAHDRAVQGVRAMLHAEHASQPEIIDVDLSEVLA